MDDIAAYAVAKRAKKKPEGAAPAKKKPRKRGGEWEIMDNANLCHTEQKRNKT